MSVRRLLAAVTGIVVGGILAAGPVAAGPLLDRAAEALRRDPVFVDPGAEAAISPADADRIRQRVRRADHPVLVAVLPEAAVAEVGEGRLAISLGQAVRREATYAVLAGKRFEAASSVLRSGEAASLARAASERHGDDGPAVLLDFVERVDRAPAAGNARGQQPEEASDDRSGRGIGLLAPLLLLAALGGGGFFLWRRRKQAREVAEARESLHPELQLLADDVLALEPQVTLHPEARGDYDAGVSRYRAAEAALGQVRSIEPDRLRRVLSEGQYAMARTRARLDDRPPPPPPPELATTGPNREPAVVVDERGEPGYAGYGGGWYGGGWYGGDLLTGILIGSALGGPGWGYGGDHHGDHGDHHGDHGDGGGDGGEGGGDAGGGDFGGGDFGGGDFGGGDFGGGDFGGGDFGGGDFGGGDF